MPYFYRNNIKYSGGSDSVDLTMAEYKELEANGKVVQDTTYYIIDADENIPSRPNLLINSNFANPVNQRGQNTYSNNNDENIYVYTIDRWKISGTSTNSSEVIVNSDSVTFKSGRDCSFVQEIEFPEKYANKKITASVKVKNVLNLQYLAIYDGNLFAMSDAMVNGITTLTVTLSSEPQFLRIYLLSGGDGNDGSIASVDIEWFKAELGEVATPYVPRLYAEELQLCKRYYQLVIGTNSICHALQPNELVFVQNLSVEMRVIPTLIFPDSLRVTKQGTYVEGFTFTSFYPKNSSYIAIYAVKASHGLSVSNIVGLSSHVIELDAEL